MAKLALGPAVPRMDDGRPERMIPEPMKQTRLARRPLAQVPSVPPSRLRHTAKPK
jgi:hypothetical protein